jgi:hypothetical protein
MLKMSDEHRDAFFNGRKDENRKTIDRGVIGIRGLKAAAEIQGHHGAATGSKRRQEIVPDQVQRLRGISLE